ncbi:MAG: glycosyltransferase [Betaproteobacteria bacterium]|nr:glycosyltransferase [Betaproteobacteria bacterium]
MRVLCFGRFCDDLPGGIQSHVLSLLETLRAEVEFVNLVPSRNGRGRRFALADGTPVICTPGWNVDGSLVLSPGLVLEARRQHQVQPFDLIHLHLPDPMSHLASLAIPAGVPRIVTWHADITRHRRLLKLYHPWQNRLLNQARAIIVATPAHLASPVFAAPEIRNKAIVIPFGFDLERFITPHTKAAEIRAAYPGKRIFALGRHVAYKGFDVLIKALAHLGAEVRLLLGGVGPLRETLERLASELGLAERVAFLGLIPDTDLPAYYQACDLFCLPSVNHAEAFGIVQVEAMAAGCPVVGTRLDNGVNFVNQDGVTGIIVPPRDVAALAKALEDLLTRDSWRHELGVRARRHALENFQKERMATDTLALYRYVLCE